MGEFKGILNYGVIGLMQLDMNDDETEDMDVEVDIKFYDEKIIMAKN